MRTRIYLETSIWGFYHDESPANYWKREAVRKLVEQIRLGDFDAYVGPAVLEELSASEEPFRARDLALVESVGVRELRADSAEVAELLRLYQEAEVLEREHTADLLHACYVTLSDIHVLVTYNCRHLANYRVMNAIRAANLVNGYRTDFAILTPEEVVTYEDTENG